MTPSIQNRPRFPRFWDRFGEHKTKRELLFQNLDPRSGGDFRDFHRENEILFYVTQINLERGGGTPCLDFKLKTQILGSGIRLCYPNLGDFELMVSPNIQLTYRPDTW